jgi:hypothetical protein
MNLPKTRAQVYFASETIEGLFEDICQKESLGRDVICPPREEYPFTCRDRFKYYHYCAAYGFDGHFYVKPTVKLIDFLAFSMDNIIGGAKFFEISSRSDGKFLVQCKYQSIIGSRRLGIFEDLDVKRFLQICEG